MPLPPYTPPELGASAFNCPHCHAYSAVRWYRGFGIPTEGEGEALEGLRYAKCGHCRDIIVWFRGVQVHPDTMPIPEPSPDLEPGVADDYREAGSILGRSPRGAAALFRLCIQKLVDQLEPGSQDLNAKIALLVQRGLDRRVQRSLDIVRVLGNEAVHPGVLDLKDDPETAVRIAGLVNLIADQMISTPNAVDQLYAKLPEEKRQAIEHRDSNPSAPA